MATHAATVGTEPSEAEDVRRRSSGGYASTEHSLDYLIERGESESERLNRQHYKLYKICRGELLDAEALEQLKAFYEREKRPLLIADVGTGTAVWASHVMRRLETLNIPVVMHGFDISDKQFPPDAPDNLKLHVQNILDAPNDDIKGKFDYVHVRLLIAGLKKDERAPAVKNCAEMLRPGGYLDWEEFNIGDVHAEPPHPAFEKMLDFMKKFMESLGKDAWPVNHMTSNFQSAGLTVKKPYPYSIEGTSQSTRTWLNINGLMVCQSFVNIAVEKGGDMIKLGGLDSLEEANKMLENAKNVIRERTSNLTLPFYRTVGRREQ